MGLNQVKKVVRLFTPTKKKLQKQLGPWNARPGFLKGSLALGLAALLVIGIWVMPSVAELITVETTNCTDCHGAAEWAQIHQGPPHAPSPTLSGEVVIQDSNHAGSGVYYPIEVDCSTCHINDLRKIHANACFTCHTTAYYDSVKDNWSGGCQEGLCHQVYHQNSLNAHLPWRYQSQMVDPDDCDLCHDPGINAVEQTNCLHCHASYANDTTPPETTIPDFQAEYIGVAEINFTMRDNDGKVGMGRTFYRLDFNPQTAGMHVLVTTSGNHALEYWSVDQSGNEELPHKTAYFTVIQDLEPPVTTSNAQSSYVGTAAVITLNATDNSTQGVKQTYYSIDGGTTIQTGTIVNIPLKSGTFTYTLTFRSEDWSGNFEPWNSVTFTVSGGSGIIRLVWGNSDTNPAERPTSADWADMYIRKGSRTGPVVASVQSSSLSNWNGVNDFNVQLDPNTAYYVIIDWYWAEGDWYDTTYFDSIYVTIAGQLTTLHY